LRALARADALGCNFVDTAMVYGDSELVLGEFLRGRRDRWVVASKYSGQPEGMQATVERQLQRLGTDWIDYYQIHWAPARGEEALYEQLLRLKSTGKVRAVGVSLKHENDVDRVLAHGYIDAVMLRLSLLDPDPFVACRTRLREAGIGVVVRSALREGFLTGKFNRAAAFADPSDQRGEWSRAQIAATVAQVEQFRFLEHESGGLAWAALRYVLGFPEVSTVAVGIRTAAQADAAFALPAAAPLSDEQSARIAGLQASLGLRAARRSLLRRILDRLRR
jgi:aryl-alcohol dehydrogenase-like predicted oxidoreductase